MYTNLVVQIKGIKGYFQIYISNFFIWDYCTEYNSVLIMKRG